MTKSRMSKAGVFIVGAVSALAAIGIGYKSACVLDIPEKALHAWAAASSLVTEVVKEYHGIPYAPACKFGYTQGSNNRFCRQPV